MNKTAIRAKILEEHLAFSRVLNLRSDLLEMRKKLISVENRLTGHPLESLAARDQLRENVRRLEADLLDAEVYCRKANPDALSEHDDAVAAVQIAAATAREAEERAAEIVRQKKQEESVAARLKQMEARKRRDLEDADLKS